MQGNKKTNKITSAGNGEGSDRCLLREAHAFLCLQCHLRWHASLG